MKKNLPEVEVIEVENIPEGAEAERVMENMISVAPASSSRRASGIWSRRCGWPRGTRR